MGVKGFDLSYSGKSSMSRWQGGLAKHLAQYKRKQINICIGIFAETSNGPSGRADERSPALVKG